MKMKDKYDAIIIGAGQAGPSLAARLTAEGLSTAIIERHQFGGTCVNNGCIPTKALVASARAAHMARRGNDFGVVIPTNIKMDMKKVKARKDAIVKQSNEGVTGWLDGMDNLDVYRGHGAFTSTTTVNVNNKELTADKIFINVGARASIPNIPGVDKIKYFTNSDIMDIEVLPEHLIIIGGSYIGLEFSQIFRRFGSKVTVIESAEQIIAREDDDVSQNIREILSNEGINIRSGVSIDHFNQIGDSVSVIISSNDTLEEIKGSHILLAAGRTANTNDLGLDKAGVKTNEFGIIEVDDTLRTNVDGVWALGECNGQGAFTHTSYNDYEIIANQLFENSTRTVNDRITCYGLFIDPPLGRIGLTETQVRNSGKPALIGKMLMSRIGRAKERSETQGFMKVLIDAESKQFLGASILGIGGDEIIHLLLNAMYSKQNFEVIMNSVHIHPTVSELIPTMLQDLHPLT